MPKFITLVRAAAWLAVLTIIVLSVVPGEFRPEVLNDKHYEHFTAYFITGCLFAFGYPGLRQMLSSGIMLAASSGVLEIIQLWIPGRTSSLGDLMASTLGAWIGLSLACLVGRARLVDKSHDIGMRRSRGMARHEGLSGEQLRAADNEGHR